MQSIEHAGEELASGIGQSNSAKPNPHHLQDELSRVPFRDDDPVSKQTYAAAGAATLAVFGGLAGVLVGWIMGASPRSIPGQGTLAGADLLSTTLVAGLFGAGVGALVGALWGLNIPRTDPPQVEEVQHQVHDHSANSQSERVVPLDYVPPAPEPGRMATGRSVSEDSLVPAAQTANPSNDVDVVEENVIVSDQTGAPSGPPYEEVAMDDRPKDQELAGGIGRSPTPQDSNNVTGTEGAIDPETGAYGTAGTPVTTGYGVSGSTIGTGSSQVRDEHEAGNFAGSTPDSSSYEMGGRGSDDTNTPSRPDDSSDTPVTEKYKGSMTNEAPEQSDPRTQDLYEAGFPLGTGSSYGPGVGQGRVPFRDGESTATAETSHNSDASLDSPPSSKLINSEETDASAGTNIAGTSDPRGLGDNTDET